MIELHPKILSKNGQKYFAVLPYEGFVTLQELLEDAEDVLELRATKQVEQNVPSVSLSDVKRELE